MPNEMRQWIEIIQETDSFPVLYHGTKATTRGRLEAGRSGFVWWTPDRKWATLYGPKVYRRKGLKLNLIHIDGESARDAYEAIKQAGVEVDDLQPPFDGDDNYNPAEECHQYLTNTPGLADRIKAAGYDGVIHPDIRYDDGIGIGIALIR